MEQITWILLKSKDRGSEFGVGTFIKNMAEGLLSNNNIILYIVEMGESSSFNVVKENSTTIIKIPLQINRTLVDSITKQKKIALNCIRVLEQYIIRKRQVVVHMNFPFEFFLADQLREKYNAKLVYTQHLSSFDKIDLENQTGLDISQITYKGVDKIIAVTQNGKKNLVKIGVNEKKIEVIYNGISLFQQERKCNENILKKYGLNTDEKIILYCGRIDAIKGLKYLCLAMESLLLEYSNCRLVIAGTGDFSTLISESRKFSTKISFLGLVPFHDLIALYQNAIIGVIPSLQEECSYVALEMLHSGLPVVASNLGGLKEIFIPDQNALLINMIRDETNSYGYSPSVGLLKNSVYQLLNDKKLRDSFSRNAVARAKEQFTTELMVSKYINTIKSLS